MPCRHSLKLIFYISRVNYAVFKLSLFRFMPLLLYSVYRRKAKNIHAKQIFFFIKDIHKFSFTLFYESCHDDLTKWEILRKYVVDKPKKVCYNMPKGEVRVFAPKPVLIFHK